MYKISKTRGTRTPRGFVYVHGEGYVSLKEIKDERRRLKSARLVYQRLQELRRVYGVG